MAERPESQEYTADYPQQIHPSDLSLFLGFLTFEGHSIRYCLELGLAFLVAVFFAATVPWELLGVHTQWISPSAWSASFIVVFAFDQLLLCRSARLYKNTYRLTLGGAFDKALKLLDTIAPDGKTLIPCPKSFYHLRRADIFTEAEKFQEAEAELDSAQRAGAKKEEILLTKIRLYRLKGDYELAQGHLEVAKNIMGSSSALVLEEGMLQYCRRETLWEAKRTFQKAMELPDLEHFSGESTRFLAEVYLYATFLWTGRAEEGLEGLGYNLGFVKTASSYLDSLRPIASFLYLERSHYYSTHREPRLAELDLEVALSLCSYPAHLRKAKLIKQELADRHGR